jgi:16S rRNA (guanine527-N7)-methyltransferase
VANASVVCARAEEVHAAVDLVTARALGELALVCEYAAPMLARGGSLVAWKGAVASAELDAGRRAARELGLEPRDVVRTSPYPGSASHHLYVYEKITDTPSRFPRRPGAARKQPLGHQR